MSNVCITRKEGVGSGGYRSSLFLLFTSVRPSRLSSSTSSHRPCHSCLGGSFNVLRVVIAPPHDDQVLDAPADVQLALPQETEVACFEEPVGRGTVARQPFRERRRLLSQKSRWGNGVS